MANRVVSSRQSNPSSKPAADTLRSSNVRQVPDASVRQLSNILAVLSGDTVIVRSKEAPEKGKPLKERSLHIAGLSAPRMGSTAREDEVCLFSIHTGCSTDMLGIRILV